MGWRIAKKLADLDVGLTVVLAGGAVLALEGMEGTDKCIKRAGELCKTSPLTVVKVARTKQDMRFDLPVIGINTIETMIKANAKTLALQADKTIILDKEEVIALADKNKISIIALNQEPIG